MNRFAGSRDTRQRADLYAVAQEDAEVRPTRRQPVVRERRRILAKHGAPIALPRQRHSLEG
ncbi:hypothetical protein BI364_12485 [Acidihalobacter yilgarnensis]|uniref:Uncharacterized protein n=1 Tax=Acidihalobacter yilgarnensis TaxID=2819280 RepID=A0A1D8IQD2_9GAMM|nr:hypothetical protein [Acidihalobacter yilgarnensis]AOU98669.1 hypothetical protein BI364_12485 [Acidihalobacter yilgarnensis]